MNLITLTHPRSPAAEAYRTLRANLHFATLEAPARTIVVTSPTAAEDKTLALANLGVVLAQAEKKVVLVDADLRRPSLHRLFDLPDAPGLADMLDRAASARAELRATAVPGLSVLPSGQTQANPSDLLNSSRMKQALVSLSAEADVVLIDAPPLLAVSDSAMLVSQVEGVLLVITAGKTRREQAAAAKDVLARARARLLGAVLLNAPRSPGALNYE